MTKKPTVLIVDDNPENLGILGDIVTENGYNPGFAPNGTIALASIKKKRPNIILLDIMMPGMDGFEVCKRLKQDPELADIPIIFLTAKTEKDDVITGLELGAVDYVTKPFSKKELLTRLNTHLELQVTKEKLQESLTEKEAIITAKEAALATKDKLFSIISHDLSNVFCGLQLLVESLVNKEMKFEAQEKEENLQALLQVTFNGYDLLTNLLNWSKSQTGKLQAKPTTLNLAYLIQRNITLQFGKANLKKIIISTNIDENMLVFADENMLDTVLRNLISNAIKFTPNAGAIQITSKQIENNFVEVLIADTGVGIETEDIVKLFRIETGYTTHGTDNEKGNGLGLILCKELVEKCEGTIRVESKVGKGSQFFVCLPIGSEVEASDSNVFYE